MPSRISPLLLMAGFIAGTASAGNDPFVGQWKLNPSRSKLTDEMKVTPAGHNKYTFDFGGGEPETVVADGTDQPGDAGSTLSVAAEDHNWKVIRKSGGRMVLTATWTLSKDGNSLTDDFTSFGQDGSPSNIRYVYKRIAGDRSGFAGTWVSTSEVNNSVFSVQISPYADGGLSVTSPSGSTNVTFDGKTARRLNADALEVIQRSKGKVTQTKRYQLSADLKTLTITTHTVGQNFPKHIRVRTRIDADRGKRKVLWEAQPETHDSRQP